MAWHVYREFQDGELITAIGYDIVVHRRTIGHLTLTSGHLIACDLIEHPDTEAFQIEVPPGTYPVRNIIAELRDDVATAYTSLELSNEPAVYWKMGMVEGEEQTYEDKAPKGFIVHSGIAALMDARAAVQWIQYQDLHRKLQEDNEVERDLNAQLRKTHKKYKGQTGWAELQHSILEPNTIIASKAGLKPGLFSTYFGYDQDDQLTRVVIDYNVMSWRFPSFKRPGKRFVAS